MEKEAATHKVNPEHVKAISERYTEFERFLLQNGMTITKDTDVGVWGVTHVTDLRDVFTRINLQDHKHFLDLGSGDGRAVLLASLFGVKATGIEYDSWLVNTSLDIKRKLKIPHFENVTLKQDDFMTLDFKNFDIVYISPDKPFFRGLGNKLQKELRGKLIVQGYEFQPTNLELQHEWIINGEKFCVYEKE
jgi:SAM-dependent methyltransferase